MAKWPAASSYPASPNAVPATPKAYPGAQAAAYPRGAPIPVIAITSPAGGTTQDVATPFTISGTCTNGVDHIVVKYGGADISSDKGNPVVITGTTWTWSWSCGKNRIGTANLTADCEVGAGPTGTSAPVSVTISAVPIASLWDIDWWHVDSLAGSYTDGQNITSWTGLNHSVVWTPSAISGTTPAPTYQTAAGGNGFPGNRSKPCLLFNGAQMLDTACPAAFTGGNARSVLIVYQQVTGTGTQTLLCASAASGSTNKWQWYSTSAPAAYKVRRNATDTTFGVSADLRNDLGTHFAFVRDPGTGNISLSREKLWQSNKQSAANAATTTNTPTRLCLGANYNGTSTPTNFANYKIVAVALSTQDLTDAQIQQCAYHALGLFDVDQYYGDATAHMLNLFSWQSNAQSLAVSTHTALPLIRFLAISTNNWVADMTTTVSIGPQGAGPYCGAWYKFAQDRRTATGKDVHICLMGQGATSSNSFKTPNYDGCYSASLFDAQCRVVQEMKCALGGTPTIDRVVLFGGETDAQSSGGSSTVQANVTTWVANLRALVPGITNSTRFVWPQVSTFSAYAFGSTVQAAAVAWAGADANGAAPDMSSLASAPFFNVDTIHYNESGQDGAGTIFAAA